MTAPTRFATIARHVLTVAMVAIGVLHFANPEPFIAWAVWVRR